MNMIEMGAGRDVDLGIDGPDAAVVAKAEADVPRHTFPRVPREGASVKEILDMLRADISALQAIEDPEERQQPAAFMALNMRDNPTYHTGIRHIAPELESELRAAAKREESLRRDELIEPPPITKDTAPGAQRWSDHLGELETRMAQSNLREMGWRDRDDIDDVLRDLERLADRSWKAAATLWDKFRPDDPDKPIFIDGDDKDPPSPSVRGPGREARAYTVTARAQDADDEKVHVTPVMKAAKDDGDFVMPDLLRKRYLIVDKKFYFRGDESTLAFEDAGKQLKTDFDDPNVARAMVALAEAKNWDCIKVKGTDDFKREVWLAASLRGMQVEGYKATDVDKARLAELKTERVGPQRNSIEQARDRDHEVKPAFAQPDAARPRKDEDAKEPASALSPQQSLAIDTLAAILRDRGESDRTVEIAKAIATERLQQQRLYVGKLLEQGNAPYDNKPDNEESPYIKLRTGSGDKMIWGVDLPRAVDDGNATVGDDVAVAFRGKRKVIVPVKERDTDGKPTGKTVDRETDRNTWEVSRLDRLRDDVKAKVQNAASRTSTEQPRISVYDSTAPRAAEPTRAPARDIARTHAPEPSGR